jgi:hypothetical protein
MKVTLTPDGVKEEHFPPKPEEDWCMEERLDGKPFHAKQVAAWLRLIESKQYNSITCFDWPELVQKRNMSKEQLKQILRDNIKTRGKLQKESDRK